MGMEGLTDITLDRCEGWKWSGPGKNPRVDLPEQHLDLKDLGSHCFGSHQTQ